MKLHIEGLGDYTQSPITTKHVDHVGAPTTYDLKKKKEINQEMLELASSLSYSEFDDIKGCDTTKKMWDDIEKMYGGDKNVLRAKAKSLRGKFDDMRMKEGETIIQYCTRIKDIMNAIKEENGVIGDETTIRKVLRTLLPIYTIRVSTI